MALPSCWLPNTVGWPDKRSTVKLVRSHPPLCMLLHGMDQWHTCTWLVIGVWSKAALWFVHGWLLDAMVAPLLVSALLHSATLVLCSMVLLHKVGFHSAVSGLLSGGH